MRRALVVAVASVVWGCGTGGGRPGTDGGTARDQGEKNEVVGLPEERELPPVIFPEYPDLADAGRDEVAEPPEAREVAEVETEVPQNCPGGSGCPCLASEECDTGLCLETMAGWVCMTPCLSEESCPAGWTCQAVAGTGSDVIYGCVDRAVNLCRPCRYDADCVNHLWGGTNRCLSYGPAGSFCGVQCQAAADCPEGYECVEMSGEGRTPLKQCRKPEGEACPCLQKYEDKGYLTECYVENEWGRCTDVRTCAEGCEAKTPSEEVCDGRDNDCDGETDEGVQGQPCPLTNAWGTCFGTVRCEGGNLFCDGEPPAAEQCDGEDNDCDGQTDEEFLDTDGDGIADCVDEDVDGDGVLNGDDNCPWDKNPGQENCDSDAYGDACDGDDDDDGVPNGWDNCRCLANPLQEDLDKDGKGDACDCDVDGDGVFNANPGCPQPAPADNCVFLANPGQSNLDGDEWGDACDCDLDGDGVGNDNPGCPTPVPRDNCPAVHNPDQADENGNGLGDACDDDADLDGVKDGVDNCVVVWNPDQADQDADEVGDACDCDLDGDGLGNAGKDVDGWDCPPCGPCDNCPGVANPGQEDLDGDGDGDACDVDRDGDGDPNFLDCAPDDPAIFHGAPEVCNLVDDDCDGEVDEQDAVGCGTFYRDVDRDGYGATEDARCLCGPAGYYTADRFGDCEDNNPDVNPDAVEVCKNGKDDNCNGFTDEEGAQGCSWFYRDLDGDVYGVEGEKKCLCKMEVPYTSLLTGDCNDDDPGVKPGATEVCNGRDDDCDGAVDEENAQGCATFYKDADQDGWGIPTLSKCLCQAEAPYSAKEVEDCNDGDPEAKPGAAERCNGKDDDCDGFTDEDASSGCTVFFLDQDRDGYGNALDFRCLCAPKAPYDTVVAGDCDDFYAAIHPEATESCNGKDDDCDGATDESPATGCKTYYFDGDGDGFGLATLSACLCQKEAPYTAILGGDCNDYLATVNPAADEVCNGRDDDCDGTVDEEDAQGCATFYLDADRDGYGVSSDSKCLCKAAGNYSAKAAGDCADDDPARNPGARERCNGQDENCNGLVDEEGATDCSVFFLDYDWDGYGASDFKCLCGPYLLYRATQSGDCNDSSAKINPGAGERCNGSDDNCDGIVDPEGSDLCGPYYKDADGDGYGKAGDSKCLCCPVGMYRSPMGTDCNDQDPTVNPGVQELCANGKDDNCNGLTDDAEVGGCQGCINYFEDVDGDGYGKTQVYECLSGPSGNLRATLPGDCNDSDGSVNPGAPEHCNGVDDDCNALTDEEGAADCVPFFYDNDDDGYGTEDFRCLCAPSGKYRGTAGGDCNDAAKYVNPGAAEVCNQLDDDCDGLVDEAGAAGCQTYYQDNDQDGWGQAASKCLCAPAFPYTANAAGDCDDARGASNPAAVEECNGRDDDCDGQTDEENALGCNAMYRDGDRDGHGVSGDFRCLCAASGEYSATEGGDCDDANATVFPGAAEQCNGRDDDCDAVVDEVGALGCRDYYYDSDADGFGTDAKPPRCLCAPQAPYAALSGGDCLDTNQNIHPGAAERCNYVDDDCDGQTDEVGATGCTTFFQDADSDGFGVSEDSRCLCAPSGGYKAAADGDCNDADAAVNPSAAERCNGRDDDCDGQIDEAGAADCVVHYRDGDGDGFGKPNDYQCLCGPAAPYSVTVGGDCDDADPAVSPGRAEACNGRDDDCDGLTDERDAVGCALYYQDVDQDGHGGRESRCLCGPASPWVATAGDDCNDSLAGVHPGAAEVCDYLDNDCDGVTDGEGTQGCQVYYYDGDGDNYGVSGNSKCLCRASGKYTTQQAGDCDDASKTVNPGRVETCNGQDDDCDGLTDEASAQGCKTYYADRDSDGFGVAADSKCLCEPAFPYTTQQGGDCDDEAASARPGAPEVCANGHDDDCDGLTDEAGCQGCVPYYRDDDGDTYGVAGDSQCLAAPAGAYRALRGGDCNDQDAGVYPGAIETCNSKDDDCDSQTDEDGASGCVRVFHDADVDGFGLTTDSRCACVPAAPYTALQGGDCDDGRAAVHPGAAEACNGLDDDCTGTADPAGAAGCVNYLRDSDQDGFGASGDLQCLCAASTPYTASVGGDCDDQMAGTHPGATEVCGNGRDDDCDGQTDEAGCQGCTVFYRDRDRDGFGVTTDQACLSGPVGDYAAQVGGDCDDDRPEVHPGLGEACDGLDNDCDGTTDPAGSAGCTTFFKDADGDGYGLASDARCLCRAEPPYAATVAGDCDDAKSHVEPGATEVCNGQDDDCDGLVDEEGATGCGVWYLDGDGDGYGKPGSGRCLCAKAAPYTASNTADCDDANPDVKPGGTEVCNGLDDDCNGTADGEGTNGCTWYYLDQDQDGYGSATSSRCLCAAVAPYTATNAGDCRDGLAAVHPDADEVCDGLDNDCDGQTDGEGITGCIVFFEDLDRDGYGVALHSRCLCAGVAPYDATQAGDCNDSNTLIAPGAAEACNGLDDDCDAVTDEEGASGCTAYHRDWDGDGWGTDLTKCLCAPAGKYTASSGGDCNDVVAAVHPGATESCNGRDDDCDDLTDEEDALGCATFHRDQDGDGYGSASDARCLCKATQDYPVQVSGDCQDQDAAVHPGAPEACNGQDDDCDFSVDEDVTVGCTVYFYDYDADGYGSQDFRCLCAPSGLYRVTAGGDCNDLSAAVNPEAQEVCNGQDDNCDAIVDPEGSQLCSSYYQDADGDGYGKPGTARCLCAATGMYRTPRAGDCDDDSAGANPDALELCGNGRDDNCNGATDESGCEGCVNYYEDQDGDTYGLDLSYQCLAAPSGDFRASRGGDCDDTMAPVNPGAAEACNGRDDDCDALTDEEGATDCRPYFFDDDGDGYGTSDARCLCAPQGKYRAENSGDCNDSAVAVNPGAPEACNDVDDDCDGLTDEAGATGCHTYFEDQDQDGFGQASTRCLCQAAQPFTANVAGDCDDYRPGVNPNGVEACNGRDDDCDGATDEEGAIGCTTFYRDGDGDRYGVASDFRCLCAASSPYVAVDAGDCDDGRADVFPGATEQCNGRDDDCDGLADEPDALGCVLYHFDGDRDGFGDDAIQPRCLCAPAAPFSAVQGGDCLDTMAEVRPGVAEACNAMDDNCDGIVDNEGASGCTVFYLDNDQDGVGVASSQKCLCQPQGKHTATSVGDCNDGDAAVRPGGAETCDGRDEDCDGQTDEVGAIGCTYFFRDDDADGFGQFESRCLCAAAAPYTALAAGDCDDTKATVKPGAAEACNARDDDCDGSTDEEGASGCLTFYRDQDADGFGGVESRCLCEPDGGWTASNSQDCNDVLASVNPQAAEVCDGLDNDCDGQTDEAGASGCLLYYLDRDADGYGDGANSRCLCAPAGGYTAQAAGDCDDTVAAVKPGATEACNGRDDDCDGSTDEEGSTGCTDYYKDADGDIFGVTTDKRCLCAPTGLHTATQGNDCDDGNALVNPARTERCNGVDDNCDGQTDGADSAGCSNYYKDGDGDLFGVASDFRCLCAAAPPYATTALGDCHDGNAQVFPGAPESCNGADDDCDGQTDEAGASGCQTYYFDQDQDGYGLASDSRCLCAPVGGYTTKVPGDCNDLDGRVSPGAQEACNGRDDDCDGQGDEEGAASCVWYFKDSDGDGYGVAGDKRCLCAASGDYAATQGGDCDDTRASVYPNATEVCGNARDDDCDGFTDEAGCQGCTTYYKDTDGDTWGVEGDSQCLSAPSGVYRATRAGDCNDADAAVSPGATESCNAVDDDCDGQTDEMGASGCRTYYQNNDGDSHGVTGGERCLCAPQAPFTATLAGDCNDADSAVFPGAPEWCNAKDDDCDALTDEEGAVNCSWYYKDADGDQYGVATDKKCLCSASGVYVATQTGDCDDNDPQAKPGGTEVCGNGKDDDCDGWTDEAGCQGCTTFYLDEDGDTYGQTGQTQCLSGPSGNYRATRGGDCRDNDEAVNPGATEVCQNNQDDDCDGQTDEAGCQGCVTYFKDQDGDTYGVAGDTRCLSGPTSPYTATRAGDCDDSNASVKPGAAEVCNLVDDNCDGQTDEAGASGCTNYDRDNDGDAYGIGSDSRCLCRSSTPYTATQTGDCNDNDAAVKPGATEVCNGTDDNCDGQTDPVDSQGCVPWYYDYDEDGFGTASSRCQCGALGLYRALATGDCNDTNAQVYPGATEACNGADDDCDGNVDEPGAQGCTTHYHDADNDGYGVAGDSRCQCGPSYQWVAVSGDCNDNNPAIRPGAVEHCDGVDEDCDGQTDDGDPVAMCGPVPNGQPVCTGGQCVAQCNSGYFDVNRTLQDGCECAQDGYGATTCATAGNLGTLSDAGSGSTVSVSGRILPDSEADWYRFTATDSTDTGTLDSPGHDRFNVRVRVASPTDGSIKVNVYRGNCSTQMTCASGSFNATEARWYENFASGSGSGAAGQDPCVTPPPPPGGTPRLWDCCRPGECDSGATTSDACCGGADADNQNPTQCTDALKNKRHCGNSGTVFYVKVYRASGTPSDCGQTAYTIQISNGVP